MSIYDKSSLVLIPSGTKTGKVYSQKPVSGDGDFTFTRSSAATRVNADGNIEKETQNLLVQSNTFSNTWTNASSTETSGQSGYDGTNDAWLLTSSLSGGRISQSVSQSGLQTFSVYLKAGSRNWALLVSTATSAYFDLVNGVVGSGGTAPIDANIESIGSGWYRCSIAASGSNSEVRIYPALGDNDVSGTGSIYIQDAQLEQGLVARDYIETTTTAVEGGITDNVPRLDYTDSSCPALLLEPQRTNLVVQSEYAGGEGWVLSGYSATPNVAISPEGLQNAFQLNIPSVNGNVRAVISVSPSTEYTFSFYVKRGTATELKYSVFNLTNLGNIIPATSYYSQTSATEWKRIEVTFTIPAGCTSAGVYIDRDSQGDGTAFFYGVQSEAGSYATSYIPTYGSSVTRVYENQDVTGLYSNVFNNDNLTLFYDFNYNAEGREGSTTAYRIFSGSSQLGIKGRSNTSRSMEIYSSGDFSGSIVFNNIANASRIKVALRVTNGTCELFFNGAKDTETIDVSAAAPYTWGQVTMLASSSLNTSLNQCLGFPTALTDQELIDLTTL
ncbi:carbohydrate binding domain-containing protein [bacterium]|nr:carbohydrate binding domain-containing protein [bacterium]